MEQMTDTIQKIAEAMYPVHPHKLTDMLRVGPRLQAAKTLTLLEPYISQWVSVEDGLPEEGQPVLIQIPNGLMQPSHFENGKFNRFRNNALHDRTTAYYYETVTHWMPLHSTAHPFELLLETLKNK